MKKKKRQIRQRISLLKNYCLRNSMVQGLDFVLSLPRAQLQSLTAELKFHKLRGKKQKQKTIVTEVNSMD